MDRYRQQYSRCAQKQTCGRQLNQACPVPDDCPAVSEDPLRGFPLAMAYVPWQQCKDMYEICDALYHGTLFPSLDLGFYGKRC